MFPKNTNVYLLKNVPLDNTYRNTLFFPSAPAQQLYFSGLTHRTFTQLSYQRKEKGLRVNAVTDDILVCNYMMFQNASFGNKWFYAFITNIEYVNDGTSEISFEIDVMQTWAFDYKLNQCLVEREHIEVDTIGANTVPENLELGEYVMRNKVQPNSLKNNLFSICVACTFGVDFQPTKGGIRGGVYTGVNYLVFSSDTAGVNELNEFLEQVIILDMQKGVLAVFMIPNYFASDYIMGTKTVESVTIPKQTANIDGYVPKNKKLFTYPYNFLYCTNNNGTTAEFHYELFNSGSDCVFLINSNASPVPELLMTPSNYKFMGYNANERMTLDTFPQCSYLSESYVNWIGSKVASKATGILSMLVGRAVVDDNAKYGVESDFMTETAKAKAVISKAVTRFITPQQARGTIEGSTAVAGNLVSFDFYNMTIRSEFAKIIDEFFSVYGYQTNRVKIPNISSRPKWNYVKTLNSSITGSIPANDLAKIRAIYDKGVTFWKNGAEVGDYSLPNN